MLFWLHFITLSISLRHERRIRHWRVADVTIRHFLICYRWLSRFAFWPHFAAYSRRRYFDYTEGTFSLRRIIVSRLRRLQRCFILENAHAIISF